MKASQMNRSRRPHARDSENRSSDQRTMVKYRVQAGDTLGKIARKFYGDASRFSCIAAANSSANPDKLRVGQELLIPDPSASPDAVTTAPSLAVSIATAANPTAGLNEQRLSLLHPVLSIRARCMIALCAQAGIPVLVTQAFRTWEEQDALYAKGRTVQPRGKKYIVTNAKGGQSYHNFGLAFDIVVLDAIGKADWDTTHRTWTRAGEIGKSVGLEWGGDWRTFKDMPHFQYTGGMTTVDCCALYPAGFQAVWERIT